MKLKRRYRAEHAQFVSGWKDIARYLDKGVRTVQRYEREFGLPVRRPAGRPRGSVVATKAEIDAWVSASPIRAAYQLLPRPVDNSNSPVAQIRRGMGEMARLREQMTQLRQELKDSLRSLQNNVVSLEHQVSHSWREDDPGARDLHSMAPPPMNLTSLSLRSTKVS